MPQCPHCQTPYEDGQRYCGSCGSFLLHPEQGDTFCPQCGIRVSPRQEFCHECDAPLKGAKVAREAMEPAPESEAPAAPAPAPVPEPAPRIATPTWLMGLLAGSGVVIIILLILLFTRGTTPPVVSKTEPSAPVPATAVPAPATPGASPAETAPPGSETALREQLQSVLSALRQAQLQKDIVQFMSVYSLTYSGLDDKRSDTLKSWGRHDYTNMVFTIDKVQSLGSDNAIAWVTWYIDTHNLRTREPSSSTQTYKVRFVKELGKWRIRTLEEVEE